MLILVTVVVAGYFLLQRSNYYSGLNVTKEWAQLSEFPASATNLTVELSGSIFTREFTVEFDAPLADIEAWLKESPGTSTVTPEIDGSIRTYPIEPGGGAQHAELELDENSGHVTINSYWS